MVQWMAYLWIKSLEMRIAMLPVDILNGNFTGVGNTSWGDQ
jgi:hypothetical protein